MAFRQRPGKGFAIPLLPSQNRLLQVEGGLELHVSSAFATNYVGM